MMKRHTLVLLGGLAGAALSAANAALIERTMFAALPASRWFVVEGVAVSDARAGASPAVTVTRDIRRSFTATRTARVLRRATGGFKPFCRGVSTQYFRAGTPLPAATDVDWWTDAPANGPCPRFEAGAYVLRLEWVLEFEGLPSKTIRVESNIFRVIP